VKLERAKQHLAELDHAITAFTKDQPFRVDATEGPDPKTGERRARIVIKRQPPRLYAAIVGDVLHNLRAALDYLAWQMVVANGGTPDRDTGYPIRLTAKSFDESGLRALRGASGKAIAAVALHQPFKAPAPEKHALAVLHRLDIRDKHQLLHVVGCAISQVDTSGFADVVLPDVVGRHLLNHGDVVLRVKALSLGQFKARFKFEVALNDANQPLRETLTGLFGAVEKAVNDLAEHTT